MNKSHIFTSHLKTSTMKKIILIAAMFFAISIQAQEYLGTWSFDSVDREAIDDGVLSAEELEKRISTVSNMFASYKLIFNENGTYVTKFMGEETEATYIKDGNTIQLEEGSVELLPNNKARYALRNMRFYLIKGDFTAVKTYTYLKESSYDNHKINEELLIGKWEVKEVRVLNETEGAEMFEMIGLMITLNFITKEDVELGVSGFGTTQKFKINPDNNDLVGTSNSGEEKIVYRIHQVNDSFMIVSQIKDNILLYMVRDM
jgi:hypothetical protein